MRTAIDSNVISALWSREPMASQIVMLLGRAQTEGGLTICAPVYAELLAYPKASPDFVNEFMVKTNVTIDFLLAEEVWLLAAESFAEYARKRRKSKGASPKRSLADFIIGAHATLRADRLLTLDKSRYERSFPTLKLL
jgi:hypothetical protein